MIEAFAQAIPARLAANPEDSTFAPEILSLLGSFPLSASAAQSADFDSHGTDIWNLSTRLLRTDRNDGGQIPCLLRVFSCYMLDAADQSKPETWSNAMRILKVLIRAAKTCLQKKQIELAGKMVEMITIYSDSTSKMTDTSPEDIHIRDRLVNQYLLIRILLAWHQSKLQVAESFYSQINKENIIGDPVISEEFADSFFEIGKAEHDRRQFEIAACWLERSVEILTEHDVNQMSEFAPDLKLTTLHLLTKTLLAIGTTESKAKASNIVELMDKEYGDKMLVSLLKLEILGTETSMDANVYHGVILRLIRSVYLTKANFKTIMHHLHKLRRINHELACKCLDEFMEIRLFRSDVADYIERATIMRMWITVSHTANSIVEELESFLETIAGNITTTFSSGATFAAQTLLWKVIETHFVQKQYLMAERLCTLANHRLFEKAGGSNKGKLLRKSMQCALARQDCTEARRYYFAMDDTFRNQPLSKFLLFKVSLQSNDEELGRECLDTIVQNTTKDISILYACSIEAQYGGNRHLAMNALQSVLEKHSHATTSKIHLPALMRCLLKLIKAESSGAELSQELAEKVCRIFEKAATHASRPANIASADFDKKEWEWFTRNCYNFALEHVVELHPQHLIALASSCIKFIEVLMSDSEPSVLNDLRIRRIHCEYLSVVACLILARGSDDIAISSQNYLDVLKHGSTLCANINTAWSDLAPNSKSPNLKGKYFDVVKYQLEAAIRLRKWDELDHLFEDCCRFDQESRRWDTLADLAFLLHDEAVKASTSSSIQAKILSFIENIITRSMTHNHSLPTTARWLRCLFQLALTSSSPLALSCISHATSLATTHPPPSNPPPAAAGPETATDQKFPAIELEWLAVSAFNHAIDFYSASDDESCRVWAERAMALAETWSDKQLARLLRSRYMKLTWADDGDEDGMVM